VIRGSQREEREKKKKKRTNRGFSCDNHSLNGTAKAGKKRKRKQRFGKKRGYYHARFSNKKRKEKERGKGPSFPSLRRGVEEKKERGKGATETFFYLSTVGKKRTEKGGAGILYFLLQLSIRGPHNVDLY